MTTVFMLCAVVGSVIVLVQFLLTLVGYGHGLGFDGEVDVDVDHGGGDPHPGDHEGGHFFSVLSFRSVVAAIAVFGLAGLGSSTSGWSPYVTIVIALGAGAAALFVVAWTMRLLYGFKDDGTVHIERAVGHHGTVYLTIPGERQGTGKVHLNLQNRTVECLAVTSKGSLPTGLPVVVVNVIGPNTVEVEAVEAVADGERLSHAS